VLCFADGRQPQGPALDSARQNLASTFVNAFVNAGFGQDKLVTVSSEAAGSDTGERQAGLQPGGQEGYVCGCTQRSWPFVGRGWGGREFWLRPTICSQHGLWQVDKADGDSVLGYSMTAHRWQAVCRLGCCMPEGRGATSKGVLYVAHQNQQRLAV
jgi:hypothetical protein